MCVCKFCVNMCACLLSLVLARLYTCMYVIVNVYICVCNRSRGVGVCMCLLSLVVGYLCVCWCVSE